VFPVAYNKVQRAERVLEKYVTDKALSPEGRDFLIASLDPMHDMQLSSLKGWPDLESSSSIVRCIKKSFTVTKPAGLTAGQNWDCHVMAWPFLNRTAMQQFSRGTNYPGNLLLYGGGTGITLGGVDSFAVDSGNPLNLYTPATSIPSGNASLDSSYLKGASRLVGLGVEAQNTTAELNRQGMVTVYRQNQSALSIDTRTVGGLSGSSPTTLAVSTKSVRSPPLTVQSALLIPGSRQWRAEDGAYIMAPFVGSSNPPMMVGYDLPVIPTTDTAEDEVGDAGPTLNLNNVIMPTLNQQSTFPASCAATKLHPIHMPGMIFTGLSPETSLQIQVNFYVETFPTPAENDILVLATPSAPYDPVALEMFSRALSDLPVGVPADFNGFGDWFAAVVKAITDFASPALLAFGQPLLAAGSTAANVAARGYLAAQTPQTKPRLLTRDDRKRKKAKARDKNNKIIAEAVKAHGSGR